jgi:LAO/AO transport system kinase
VLLCEAAGFDAVLVEPVGVGQSAVAVADLVDQFVLIASPAGGDEQQGITRGILELADLNVVNKADGDLAPAAQRAATELRHAVHLLRPKRPGWDVPVTTCSALTGAGIPELWDALVAGQQRLRDDGLEALRAQQSTAWMWSEVTDTPLHQLRTHPDVQRLAAELERSVAAGDVAPAAAAQRMLSAFLGPDAQGSGRRSGPGP